MGTIQQKNKDLVLEAFDALFNKRDYARAETFWSPKYIQHSAHIEPGREGLFNLVKSIPATLKYEPGVIVADREFVIVHGRFSGMGLPVNWIAPTSCVSRTVFWLSIGTSSRTRREKSSRRARHRCLVHPFPTIPNRRERFDEQLMFAIGAPGGIEPSE